jgi:hypothetical protein
MISAPFPPKLRPPKFSSSFAFLSDLCGSAVNSSIQRTTKHSKAREIEDAD